MKRYLIFAALSPLLGGFWLLLTTTVMSGYWSHPPSLSEAEKLLAVFASTLQYSYLFGLLPAWQATRSDAGTSLREGGRGSVGRMAWIRLLIVKPGFSWPS